MRIGLKIVLGYVAIVSLVGAVGAVGLSAITTIDTELGRLSAETLPLIEALEDVRFAGLRIVASTSELGFIRAERGAGARRDAQAGQESALIARGAQRFTAALGAYRRRGGLALDEESAYAQLRDAGAALLQTSAAIIALTDRGIAGGPVLELKGQFEQDEQRFFEVVDAAIAREHARLRDRQGAVAETLSRASRTMLFVGLLALLGALAGSALLARAIARPIAQLTAAAAQIGRGAYDTRLAIRSRDELGELMESFNLMVRQLRDQQAATEQRIIAEQARDAAEQASRAKSMFLASMSHELRAPLTTIIGYSELLELDARQSEDLRLISDVGRIHAAGRHLLTLINTILDLSKIEAGKMQISAELHDLASLMQEVTESFQLTVAQNSNILIFHQPGNLGMIRTDTTRLRQIMYNLLSNAAKFTQGGIITFTADRVARADGEWVELRVADTGIGIAPAQMQRLFTPFSQANDSIAGRYGGTGLGLALTRGLCQLLGGDISVSSELGRGSAFTVCLPASLPEHLAAAAGQPDAREDQPPALAEGAYQVGPIVLVIDDDPLAHDVLTRSLESQQLCVIGARDGREGLELAEGLCPAAIILDLLLPDWDGLQLVEALRALPNGLSTPIVAVTTRDLTVADHEQLSRSAVRVLRKGSYSRDDLLLEVRAMTAPQPATLQHA